MALKLDTRYPSIDDLRAKAKKKIPRFAFEYLDGGCNEDVNLVRNTVEIRDVQLKPNYLRKHHGSSLKTKLFGIEYDAPFGIAPVGLQGLMWPNSPEILAKAAFEHNIPFILRTVTTTSIERASELTEGKAWFQLYHPTEDRLRDDIIKRAESAACPVLVIASMVRRKIAGRSMFNPDNYHLHNYIHQRLKAKTKSRVAANSLTGLLIAGASTGMAFVGYHWQLLAPTDSAWGWVFCAQVGVYLLIYLQLSRSEQATGELS